MKWAAAVIFRSSGRSVRRSKRTVNQAGMPGFAHETSDRAVLD
ncbi:MAG: hypothetical protein ABR569_08330 [Gaiellaceae bacterium]